MKKVIQLLAFVLSFVLFSTSVPVYASDEANKGILDVSVGKGDLVILYTNDAHAKATSNIGYSGVAALKKEYINKGATVLLLDAGDAFQGMPFASLDKGESVVDVMNLVGYDVMTPGCQDFNYGSDQLLNLNRT